jgi:hypothetical protein
MSYSVFDQLLLAAILVLWAKVIRIDEPEKVGLWATFMLLAALNSVLAFIRMIQGAQY